MAKKNLYGRFLRAIQSGQSGIWLQTHEPDEAMLTITQCMKERDDWVLRFFDCVKGLKGTDIAPKDQESGEAVLNSESSYAAVLSLLDEAEKRAIRLATLDNDEEQLKEKHPDDLKDVILVLRNGHRELENSGTAGGGPINRELLMAIMHVLAVGKAHRCHLVVLTFPEFSPPVELRDVMQVIEHDLPNFKERNEIVEEVLGHYKTMTPERIEEVTRICGGLTRGQVERVCAEAAVDGTKRLEKTARELKNEIVNSSGLLKLFTGLEKFESHVITRSDETAHLFDNETPASAFRVSDDELYIPGLGGNDGVKQFCTRILTAKNKRVRPRGLLLLGIPGTGKSAFAKALGNEMGWPTLQLDIGMLMGSLVGQTEASTRRALKIADAMAPCVLFVDEMEKALAGTTGGEHDSGVSARMLGSLLTWMNDHESFVYFVGTCNDISKMPDELTREGRFDATFFMDLPGRAEKDVIWEIYLNGLGLPLNQKRPNDENWTGGEIRGCCTKAHLLGCTLVEAAKTVIPKMISNPEKMNGLRRWAKNRCLSTTTGEIYDCDTIPSPGTASNPPLRRRRAAPGTEE